MCNILLQETTWRERAVYTEGRSCVSRESELIEQAREEEGG